MSLRVEFRDFRTRETQVLTDVPPGSLAIFQDVISENISTFYMLACLGRAHGNIYAQVHSSTDKDFVADIPRGGLNDSTLVRNIGRFGSWGQVVTTYEHETGLLRAMYVPDTYAISLWQPINEPVPDLP